MCVLSLSTAFAWNFSHSKKNSARYRHSFRKILKYQISWKSVQWEPSCSMRTDRKTDRGKDGRTYMTKLIGAFHNFAQAPSNPRSAYTVHLYILHFSEKKQRLFPSRQYLLCGKGWTFKYIIIWHYNPLWVFAFSAKSLHVLLSLAVSFQFFYFQLF